VDIIRDALVAADSEHTEEYTQNSVDFVRQLDLLDQKYREGLSACPLQTIVTSHAAFGYVAKRYGFAAIPIVGLSSEDEPSPRRVGEIVNLARENDIAYIFFDPLESSRLAETVAREIGGQTIALNPIEGLTESELRAGTTYLSLMEENLRQLRTALQCP
jgi:zinc transport system substrate-binding protein